MNDIPFVELKTQYDAIKSEIDDAIRKVIDKSVFIGGEIVEEFEEQFAAYIGVKHCIGCANGSDALEMALKVLDIGPGDEVIVPAMTWVSTAGAVSCVGALPVFADIDPDYYTISINKLEGLITDKTKAIIPVHLYGNPAAMVEVCKLATRYDLKVIEDCAQAHGASIGDKKVGSYGDIATFSFYPGKNLGAYGDGGAILTNDDELAFRLKVLGNVGQDGKHNHLIIGRNSRLDTLQAAILGVKLEHLDNWNAKRKMNAMLYFEKLSKNPLVKLPTSQNGFDHIYHVFAIQFKDRDLLKLQLSKVGISTQIHYPKALPDLVPYKHMLIDRNSYQNSFNLASNELSLPLYSELTADMISFVCESINKFTK